MAKKLQYVGTSHVREILKRDWTSVGINEDKVVWNRDDEDVHEVSDEAAEFLLRTERDSFKVVEDEPRQMGHLNPPGGTDANVAGEGVDTPKKK